MHTFYTTLKLKVFSNFYLHGLDRTKKGKDQNWLFAFGEMKLMLSAVKTNKCCIQNFAQPNQDSIRMGQF